MSDTDDIFLKRFSLVIAILVGIAIVCLVIAGRYAVSPDDAVNPSRVTLANDRTLPVGAVRTEITEADLATAAPVAPEPVDPASIDGAAVYTTVCSMCHAAGVAGAPIPGSDLWAERAAKGEEELVHNAINGLNAMPPKGGRLDLSDAEVIAAVEHMLAQ